MGYHDPRDVKIIELMGVAVVIVLGVLVFWDRIVEVAPWLPWVIYAIVGVGIVVGILLIVGFIDYAKESKKKQKIKDSIKSKILDNLKTIIKTNDKPKINHDHLPLFGDYISMLKCVFIKLMIIYYYG